MTNELETVIDFGTNYLRLSIFNSSLQNIYSSKINVIKNPQESVNGLIKDAEKNLSKHIDYINVLYDTLNFKFIELSIKKTFDQSTLAKNTYENLIEEANFIVKENYFKDQIIHTIVNNIILDNNENLEISEDTKMKSIILEIKFIFLSKSIFNEILNKFKRNNLNVSNIYCSSYVKSYFFKQKFQNKKNLIFLDVGFERSSAWFLSNKKFSSFTTLPIGGNTITKDISKILKISMDFSEDLKIFLNQNEKELNYSSKYSKVINPYSNLLNKNISLKLLKQIIKARFDEIIELAVIKNYYYKKISRVDKPIIIFTGNGSKLASSIYRSDEEKNFSELIFFNENESMICEAGIYYNISEESRLSNSKDKPRKLGFFEMFFNLFSK